GPKRRAALRRSIFARARSPSCAIAMPRSASAGASSRSATRLSAPIGSPAASARAAAVISESIRIPPHLSLPRLESAALNLSPRTPNLTADREGPERKGDEGDQMMTTHSIGTREEWLAARLDLLKAEKELTRRSDELARRRQELPWVRI